MKIGVFDTNQFKFTQSMIDRWKTAGHEVRQMYTCHMPIIEWADVLWFDCVDGNLLWATGDEGHPYLRGKKVIARAIDLDVWAGHFKGVNWQYVNHLVFIAPHIREYFLSLKGVPKTCQVHTIPCGVDLERFPLKRDLRWSNNIAVVMRLWMGKGVQLLMQAIAMFPQYNFHICGAWGMGGGEREWFTHYWSEFLEPCHNWMLVDSVPDMSEWLEDKTYSLICSGKEAFSYAAGEAMAKGLQPLIHSFYGAKSIWPTQWVWRTLDDLRGMLDYTAYRPHEYREFMQQTYSLDAMMERVNVLLD